MRRRLGIGVLAGCIATMAFLIATFSTASSRLTCEGTIALAGDIQGLTDRPASLAGTIETPRWFAVWTSRSATISWEVEPGRHAGQGSTRRIRSARRSPRWRGHRRAYGRHGAGGFRSRSIRVGWRPSTDGVNDIGLYHQISPRRNVGD